YGYSPGAIICPTCPALRWCQAHGYKSQFKYKANRAYVHAHLHTDYPAGEDMVIVDELTHKSFVGLMNIWPGDVINALSKATIGEAQRALLTAIISMFSTPNLSNLAGAIFYEVLERFYPDLRNVDAWGDGSLVQSALNEVAFEFSAQVRRTIYEAEELPQQFGEKLFAILSDDVRRLNAGQMPTGRIRMAVGKTRRIELSYAKGALPAWYGQRPTIVMNATADPDIMQHLIGPVKVVAPVVAPAAGATIIQDLTMNNAKSSLVGNSPEADKRRTIWLGNIRRHIEAHPGGEADTVIITTKALLEQVRAEFPAARAAYYHALEGRNDLQGGLTILANTPPINLDAIKREAAALYPGIDATLTRTSVAFDEANASGEHMAVEQIDGADPRLQALIWQHRDAAVIQAAHRSRILRNPDRTVVIMFSRPIPGLRPTQIIRDYAATSAGRAEQRQAILSSLIEAGGALIDDVGGFTVESLAGLSESSVNTVRKYWQDITTALSLHWLDLPVLQTLNHGTARARTLRVALPREAMDKCKMHVDHERYKNRFITFVIYVQPLLPHGWTIDESILHDMMNMGPAAPEPVKEAPIAVPLAHRWRFVGQASLLIGDLVLSDRSEDTDKRRTAKTLRGYLDGHHHDHRLAYLAAFEIGVQACRGIQWGALAKTVNT
ncbi:MAG: hypothetical protein M3Q45_04795, partial [Chloroflexota bacterium]|nr:hypothetical protein [Chloroflexota bacterium]